MLNQQEMRALRAKCDAAKARLVAEGWTFTHSVMHDGGATGNYGSCFIKRSADGERLSVYLNKDTVDTLLAPKEGGAA